MQRMPSVCGWIAAGLLAVGCGPADRSGGGEPQVDATTPPGPDARTPPTPPIEPDGAAGTDSGPTDPLPPPMENGAVFAHTATDLYKIDPVTFAVAPVGPFGWPAGGFDQMTDIAIDGAGRIIGVSFTKVYEVDPNNASCRLLSTMLAGSFNGLSFVPAEQVGATGPDVLVGSRNTDGKIFRIDPATGAAVEIGDMGPGMKSSGDIVSVRGFGTVATVTTGIGIGTPDQLVRLDPITFHATPIGTNTAFTHLWGLGFWAGKVFGFSDTGAFIQIDTQTGVGTQIQPGGQSWWGAAVTTLAPPTDPG